jgi:hypothetical protein
MTRQTPACLFLALALLSPPRAFAQHIDPDANAHAQDLTFVRHVDTPFTTATLDPALAFGTRLLQRCDRISAPDQDVACGVTLRRSGAIGTFGVTGDGNDVITTQAEMNAVISLGAARVKVVTSISACGGQINTSIIGCGFVGAVGIVSESGLGTNLLGEELTHEFGHNQGLGHRGDAGSPPAVGNPLLQNPLGGRDEVELTECAAFHAGGVVLGPNTPVNFAPNITTCAPNRTVQCSASGGTPTGDPQLSTFFSAVVAEDGCEAVPTISNNGPGLFPVGGTLVTFTATDAGSLTATCSATVTVVDTIQPNITCPAPITVECTATGGTPASNSIITGFLGGATATDVCDPLLPISNNGPGFFNLGTTPVQFSTVDDSLNSRACSANVTVVDTTPPIIGSLTASPNSLWPPDHKLVPISLTVSLSDVCDANAAASCHIVSVTSNEPINSTGDGETAPDWVLTGPLTLQLRAERAGNRNVRVYTVTVACSDGSGNTSTRTVPVTVAHDQGL